MYNKRYIVTFYNIETMNYNVFKSDLYIYIFLIHERQSYA